MGTTNMKYTALLVVACFAFLSTCDAGCQTVLPVDGQIGCVFRGVPMDFGTTKEIDCYKCTCDNTGMIQCCDVGATIVSYPRECEVIQIGCYQKAVMINNNAVECKQGIIMVGK